MARSLIFFVAFTTLTLVAADPPSPRLIDFNPWAWLPTSRNRSPSIMDYFFPPSRTPKHTILQPPADRSPPDTSPSPTTLRDKLNTADMQTTSSTRKTSVTSGKTKSTIPSTLSSAPPTTVTASSKVKKTTNKKISELPDTTYEVKTTQAFKTEKTSADTTLLSKSTTAAATSTPKPTKRYTIHPIRNTEKVTSQETEMTSNTESDSTETITDISEESTGTMFTAASKESVGTLSTVAESRATDAGTGSTITMEGSTQASDTTATDSADSREGYLPLRDKPHQTHVKINEQTKKETVPLPAGSTSVLAKPTKYHYYPHNQHIYLLPECAIQQVCNAVYVRLNYTQPLCACPSRYRDPCSASLNADDLHTTRLTTDSKKKFAHKAVTLVKTCEAVSEMRECRAPRDWSLLALQNIRTGKSHYLVICRCPENHILEGPMSHDQPTYASVPGIRVYGMMCVRPTTYQPNGYNANRFTAVTVQSTTSGYKVDYSQAHYNPDKPAYNRFPSHPYLGSTNYYNRMSRVARVRRMAESNPPFPWYKVREFARTIDWSH